MEQSNAITFIRSTGGRLKLSKEAVCITKRFVQDECNKLEAGGVLLGRYLIDSQDIVVDHATTPMKGDKRSRFFFFRGKKTHQKTIEDFWKDNNATCNYIGEWHTHPEEEPNPSIHDINNWKKLLKKTVFEDDYLYFLIVGTKKVSLWEGNKRNLKIIKLNLVQNI